MREIVQANVIGKSQNRTALGMMAAFIKMHPNATNTDLKAYFSKQKVCPDAGAKVGELFYTAQDIEHEKATGNALFVNDGACFTKHDEWLSLGNGEKVAFFKIWSAQSLALLQNDMAKFGIYGEVGTPTQAHTAGYAINYKYEEFKESQGLPLWIWAVVVVVILGLAYFAYKAFM